MKRLIFVPHNLGSEGCRDLARSIGAIRSRGDKVYKKDVLLINWGRSDFIPKGNPFTLLNNSASVGLASDKLKCFRALQSSGVEVVPFCTMAYIAEKWIESGDVVYGRKLLNSSQGNGIIVMKNESDVVPCPLYTRGILKAHEYRVHVFRNKVIDVTKKRRRNESDTNDFVKNLANGWVYCREDIDVPDSILYASKDAIRALGLDFGAVDILFKNNKAYVLEVNTAPGLIGTTLSSYVNHFRKLRDL